MISLPVFTCVYVPRLIPSRWYSRTKLLWNFQLLSNVILYGITQGTSQAFVKNALISVASQRTFKSKSAVASRLYLWLFTSMICVQDAKHGRGRSDSLHVWSFSNDLMLLMCEIWVLYHVTCEGDEGTFWADRWGSGRGFLNNVDNFPKHWRDPTLWCHQRFNVPHFTTPTVGRRKIDYNVFSGRYLSSQSRGYSFPFRGDGSLCECLC